jgi:GTP1/Obg family GTP-binding protein
MPRRKPLDVAIQDAVVVITDAVRDVERQACEEEARRRRAVSTSVRHSRDALRQRLAEIEKRLPDLGRLHQQWGDALAGQMIAALERERKEILAKVRRLA